jgi:hypothetical protein
LYYLAMGQIGALQQRPHGTTRNDLPYNDPSALDIRMNWQGSLEGP